MSSMPKEEVNDMIQRCVKCGLLDMEEESVEEAA